MYGSCDRLGLCQRDLKAHYISESYTQKVKARADKSLETAYFYGRSKVHTFEKYLELLNRLFMDLELAEEPVPEERQVRILLHGI